MCGNISLHCETFFIRMKSTVQTDQAMGCMTVREAGPPVRQQMTYDTSVGQ